MLETDGWVLSTTKGDHRQFKHPTKKGKVTIRGKASDDLTQIGCQSLCRFCLIVEHPACLILEGVAGYVKRIRQARCRQANER